MSSEPAASPTGVRYLVLTVATVMSVLLYLDRFAVSIASEYIRQDLRMTQTQMAWFISAFFWSYALFQVPAGWLSDRFGGRAMLSVYILAWSVFTGLMGLADAVWMMLWLRLLCGLSQAGAYPTSAGLIRRWFPLSFRGSASSIVGLGGRIGGVLAPLLTAWLIARIAASGASPILKESDILDPVRFVASFAKSVDVAGDERGRFRDSVLVSLPAEKQQLIETAASAAAEELNRRLASDANISKSLLDLRDWIPASKNRVPETTSGMTEIVEIVATQMSASKFDFKLPDNAPWRLRNVVEGKRQQPTLAELIEVNRYILQSIFPAEIRKFQGAGWRTTIVSYGIVGIVVAMLFWTFVRNSPAQHPWCNDAERQLIGADASSAKPAVEADQMVFPWRAFLTDMSLWGSSLTQFFTNLGWFFVVSLMPRYLDQIHGIGLVKQGVMTALPSALGILGLFLGGRCADWAVRQFGLKLGRRIPLVTSRFIAAAGYGFCLLLSFLYLPGSGNQWLPWLYVGGLCVSAMFTDFGTPPIWAYAQDVGGRFAGSIFGWGNMWGNLGAAVAPLVYNACLGETPSIAQWNVVFAVCCGSFVLAGLFAMLLDSTKVLTIHKSS